MWSDRKFAMRRSFYRVNSVLAYDTSVSISATRESVWRVLAAIAEWSQWLPTVNSVEPLDSQLLSRGARYKIILPKLRPATWVVTALEPPHRFVWKSKQGSKAAKPTPVRSP